MNIMNARAPIDSPQERCPTCSAILVGGLCRQCLLLAGMKDTAQPRGSEQAGGEAQESWIDGLFPELEDIQLIGRGGMGVVYQAHQRDIDRDIALKLLSGETMDAPEAMERFEIEARAAARLDHPNIVALYEFGERGGSLFLKMKLVEAGRSLAHALKEHSPWPPKEGVALLIKVARAVHHAHQHGVIHRDIKPGNMLLDPQGEPLLSDFGLARLVEENVRLTRSQIVLGTASYMAPEQADGRMSELTTAADVYSLGAVLYELLTGRPPFEGATTAEILRRVIDPVPPHALTASVDRDLSTACLKCLEKNPARRYGSAEALAEDLTLWQQGRPISARPISTAGRITKWARRRPAIAILTGALAASVAMGSTLALWQAVRATRARQISVKEAANARHAEETARREAANALRAEKSAQDEAANARRAEKSAQDEAANARRAEKSARDEAAISKEVNDFINDDLLGAADPEREPNRDLKVRAVLDRAVAGLGNRFQDQPLVEAAIRMTLARTYLSLGEYEKAQQQAERSAELRQRVLRPEHPDTLKSRLFLVVALNGQGKFAQSEIEARALLKIQERVLGPEHLDTLANWHNLATVLSRRGKFAEAEAEFRAILQIRQRVYSPEHPETLRTRGNLALTLEGQGKFAQAEAEFRAVLEIEERVLGQEHPETLRTRGNLALTLKGQGKFAQAEAEFRAVLEIEERVLGPEHPYTLGTRGNLALTLKEQWKLAQAEAEFRALLAIEERVVGPDHPDTLKTRSNLAILLSAQGKNAEAEAEHRAVLEIEERVLGPKHPDTLFSRHDLADVLRQEGKYAQAQVEFGFAFSAMKQVLGPEHPATLTCREHLAITLQDQGQLEGAEAEFRAVHQIQERVLGPEHPNTLKSASDLALCLKQEGKVDEAREFARRALEGRRKVLGPTDPRTKYSEKLYDELNSTE
jgi:tetratricopeptide (TPR) repeat protein/tRNA A-37 threonylcarbamoyl transferase component Bud32